MLVAVIVLAGLTMIEFFLLRELRRTRHERDVERFRLANLRHHVGLAIEDLEKDRENQTCAVIADFLRSAS